VADQRIDGLPRSPRVHGVVPLLVVELVCILAFAVLMAAGKSGSALAVLIGPMQIALVIALLRSDMLLLSYFSLVSPLATVELLPLGYQKFALQVGVLGLIGVLALLDHSRPGQPPRRAMPPGALAALQVMAVAIVLATIHAVVRGWWSMWMLRLTSEMLFVLLAVWIFSTVPRTLHDVRELVYFLAFGYVLACLAIPFITSLPALLTSTKVIDSPFGGGARANMNLVAMAAGPIAALLLGVLHDPVKPHLKAWLAMSVTVLVTTLAISQARGAWLGFGLAVLFLGVRFRSLALVVLPLAGASFMFLVGALRNAVEARVEQTGLQDPSLVGRLLLWATAAKVFASNWVLGIGVENFRQLKYSYGFPRFLDPLTWHGAHNMFIEAFVSTGIFGGTAFLFLPFYAVTGLERRIRARKLEGHRGLAAGVNAAIIAYGVHCLMDSPGWHAPTFLLWGVLLGLALALQRISQENGCLNACPSASTSIAIAASCP